MIRDNQPAILAATGIVSLAIGFGAAMLLMPQRPANQQIVNPTAWEQASPVAATQVSYAISPNATRCDPFDVSEVAMEMVLDEMLRRGWRAPSQGYAVSLLDPADTMGIEAIDPSAPMPPRGGWPRQPQDAVAELPIDGEMVDGVVAQPAAEPLPAPQTVAAQPPV